MITLTITVLVLIISVFVLGIYFAAKEGKRMEDELKKATDDLIGALNHATEKAKSEKEKLEKDYNEVVRKANKEI